MLHGALTAPYYSELYRGDTRHTAELREPDGAPTTKKYKKVLSTKQRDRRSVANAGWAEPMRSHLCRVAEQAIPE